MALSSDAVGKTSKEFVHSYTWKDTVLYALSVGATLDELDFLHEGRGPKVLPTYAVVPAFPACMDLIGSVGGNLMGVVHGAQRVVCHQVFKPADTLRTVAKVAGIYDLKRLAQALMTTETRNEAGELVCTTEWQILFRFDGGFGGDRPERSFVLRAPARDADSITIEKTTKEQAALYRLNGDLNPLHIDPGFASGAGFAAPILHGLCTFGYAGRAVLRNHCGGEPARLKEFYGQFRAPVWPGETLQTKTWKDEGRFIVELSTAERPSEIAFGHSFAVVD